MISGPPGALPLEGGRCRFEVWAPHAAKVELRLVAPDERRVPLERDGRGYHRATVDGVAPGARYLYVLDDEKERPDPASRLQPEGVHGPSEVVDPRFDWRADGWRGLPLRDFVTYELHVGTFTPEGTFDAAIERLEDLVDLGVTAIELMPVAQFPGARNWGYDGVFPYAAQNGYGGPDGLRRLVDAAHGRGLAVVLDVVHNHLGPEGNYLAEFGPYFTDRYATPWGDALNFDGDGADEVRRFFIESALWWVDACRIDALRLDAVHAMLDLSATHYLEELGRAVHERAAERNRAIHLIAESDLNAPRMVRSRQLGGYGLDAQWADDLHHALHVLLTGERQGYYAGYGRVGQLAKAYRDGWVYTGQLAPHRGKRHGAPSDGLPAETFVVCIQNHDQVGNRMRGERLGELVSFEAAKLAAAAVLLSPFQPLLFMGEEYGDPAPFPYFVSHSDPELVEAVRAGRKEEFRGFAWAGEPPDPQAEATFRSAILRWELRGEARHRELLDLHRELLRLRRDLPALRRLDRDALEAVAVEDGRLAARPDAAAAPPPDAPPAAGRALLLRRWAGGDEVALALHFEREPGLLTLPLPAGRWRALLDTADERWGGAGARRPDVVVSDGQVELELAPESALLLRRETFEAP